jgi:hypothetical protein
LIDCIRANTIRSCDSFCEVLIMGSAGLGANKRIPPALKHGAYSNLGLLPGEDPEEFEKFLNGLRAEWNIRGPSEEAQICHIASLEWRRSRMRIYRLAEIAKRKYWAIHPDPSKPEKPKGHDGIEYIVTRDRLHRAKEQTRHELGEAFALVELGDVISYDELIRELEVVERLNRMLERAYRDLMIRQSYITLDVPMAPRSRRPAVASVPFIPASTDIPASTETAGKQGKIAERS